ncbi:hypothetical protein SDC9_144023 [bioreactor metagenome]|uniref:Uncharacterized protein n=1 Tax=bioreactor metagenome TaxID=1076179 RepID=A0A645E648_9ZZZZ
MVQNDHRRLAALQRADLVFIFIDKVVERGLLNRAGFAETDIIAQPGLHFKHHMLQHMGQIRSFSQAVQKAAGIAQAAAVCFQTRKAAHKSLVKARNAIGGDIAVAADVDRHANDRSVTVNISAGKHRNISNFNAIVFHGSDAIPFCS